MTPIFSIDFPSGFPIKSQIVFSKSKIAHIFPAGSIHWWWIFQYFPWNPMNSLLIVEAKILRLPATTKPGWAAAPKKATFAIGSCWCLGENLGTPKKYGGNVENPEKETTSWGSLSVVMVNILGPKNWKVHWHDGPKICKQGCSSDSGEGHGMTWLCSKCDVQNIQSKGHLRPILSLKTQKLYEFLHSNPQRKLDTMI